jgi:hypothetical protein
MKRSVLIPLALLALLGLVGCSRCGEAPRTGGGPAALATRSASSTSEAASQSSGTTSSLLDPAGNVVLFVDNGSIPGEAIDIKIYVDGEKVVDRDFPSARDSQVQPSPDQGYYILKLPRGRHELRAESRKGAASLQRVFVVEGKLWLAVAYSYNTPRYGTPSPREFNMVVSKKEMGRD